MTTREVVLEGGSPWGFRMHGGVDVQQPLRISRVNPGSKAAVKGVREGDIITSINNQSTRDLTNADAHVLLKKSGDTLKLGLNEDSGGSVKRRQYTKTVQQENHSESIEQSSVTKSNHNATTTVTINKNLYGTNESYNPFLSKENGYADRNGELENGVISQQSTLSSNYSSSPSTTSLLTEPQGIGIEIRQEARDSAARNNESSNYTSVTEPVTKPVSADNEKDVIADSIEMGGNSRSHKRRSRANRKKPKNSNVVSADAPDGETMVEIPSTPLNCDVTDRGNDVENSGAASDNTAENIEVQNLVENKVLEKIQTNYRVESPETISKNNNNKSNKKPNGATVVKSRSLDDDDVPKITELSEASEGEDKSTEESNAIVSEAESDVESEKTEGLKADDTNKDHGECSGASSLTSEEKLETVHVNLISLEDEKNLRDFLEGLNLVTSPDESADANYKKEGYKERKARKRAAIAEHFMPVLHHPRYLDVIREEGSDGDAPQPQNATLHTFIKSQEFVKKDAQSIQKKMETHFPKSESEKVVVVGAKLTETANVQGTWSTSVTETSSGAEVVYIEESSRSKTPSETSDVEESRDTDEDSKSEALSQNSSLQDLNTDLGEPQEIPQETDNILPPLSQLTPPPTPDNSTPKNETVGDKQQLNPETVDFIADIKLHLTQKDYAVIREIKNNPKYVGLSEEIKNKVDELLSQVKDDTLLHQEDTFNKAFKGFCDELNLQDPCKYVNAVSPIAPSRSPSVSSEGSSKTNSQCTARYNPMCSSIADVADLLKDEENLKDALNKVYEPETLRELCIKELMSLPFGGDILEELAEVSQSIQELTNNWQNKVSPSLSTLRKQYPSPIIPAFMSQKPEVDETNNSFKLPATQTKEEMPTNLSPTTKWVGIPTQQDPRVLLCLSPIQKSYLEKTKKVPDEAGKLLELHEKFVNRRGYHEELQNETNNPNTVQVTTLSPSEASKNPTKVGGVSNNRLLAIIRDATDAPPIPNRGVSIKNMQYHHNMSRKEPASELQRSSTELNEWLHLAREKSASAPHLEKNFEFPTEKTAAATGTYQSTPVNEGTRVQSPGGNIPRSTNIPNRRFSLPQEVYQRQIQYIREKEKEIQEEIEKLEKEKRKVITEMATEVPLRQFEADKYHISKKGDIAIHNDEEKLLKTERECTTAMPMAPTEFFRQKMYDEYMSKFAAREERKLHKVIKITSSRTSQVEESNETNNLCEVTHVSGIEDEFMDKVKERMQKFGMDRDESEEPSSKSTNDKENSAEPVLVIDGDSLKDSKELPKHLQEFVDMTRRAAENSEDDTVDGVWSPGQTSTENRPRTAQEYKNKDEPIPPVWVPRSAGSSPTAERKEYRPVNFESPVLGRKTRPKPETTTRTPDSPSVQPPWQPPTNSSDVGVALSSSLERRIPTSHSAPVSGFTEFSAPRLPRAQNPTITLLQKAREGQLPRGAAYLQSEPTYSYRSYEDRPPLLGPGEVLYQIKNEYTSESDSDRPRKMADLGPRQYDIGIGPTTRDGMPLVLRSEVKAGNQHRWYKRMYDTIHKQKPDRDYVTVRYKQRRARYPYSSGYFSEPEQNSAFNAYYYDSDGTASDSKYATLDRRRAPPPSSDKENDYMSSTLPDNNQLTLPNDDVTRHGQDVYKNQPGRIENYVPGRSSISEKEAKEWWDEVMDIFDGWLDDHSALPSYNYLLSRAITRSHLEQQKNVPPHPRSFMNQALKESGYESDSTLVFRRREDALQQLSPLEQREVYKSIQKGGDVPLHGLRKLAPERPKEDTKLEYFPISPTLTRIRIHKNTKPDKNILCYPLSTPSPPRHVFSEYKRTAPSSASISSISKLPPVPPSPPKRQSSRNSNTLRLISTMKVRTEKSPSSKRHETCFTSASDVDKNKVKYLKDKITCKLSPGIKKKGEVDVKPRLKVTKTVTVSPSLKSSVTSTLSASKSTGSVNKISSRTDLNSARDRFGASSSPSLSPIRKICKSYSTSSVPKKASTSPSKLKPGTFGAEKRKVDLTIPKLSTHKNSRITKSTDLLSPTEVKKAVISQINSLPTGIVYKKSSALYSSVRNGLSTAKEKVLPIQVGFNQRGRELLRSSRPSSSLPATPILSRTLKTRTTTPSPSPSIHSEKSKSSSQKSLDSLKSTKKDGTSSRSSLISLKSTRSSKFKLNKDNTNDSAESKKLKKSKKDQLNGEIVKRDKKFKTKPSDKLIKSPAERVGDEITRINKIGNREDSAENIYGLTQESIRKQRESIQTDSFFQHLFWRDIPSPPPSVTSQGSWITEKAKFLQRNPSFSSEPTIGALKIYLNHTKPVTDSKFRSLDAAFVRSRSASPKSVTWKIDKIGSKEEKGRSISLPPRLIFSQTSRPVSPILVRKQAIDRRRHDSDRSVRYGHPSKLVFTETSRPVSPVVERRTYRDTSTSSEYMQSKKRSDSPLKLFFTETSRPVSPVVERKVTRRDEFVRSSSPTKIILTETSRPISPILPRRYVERNNNFDIKKSSSASKIILTETSRPVSPVIQRKRISRKDLELYRRYLEDERERNSSPTKLYFSETSRPVLPIVERRVLKRELEFHPAMEEERERSVSPSLKLYFSETSRPVSPIVERKHVKRTASTPEKPRMSLSDNQRERNSSPSLKLFFSETSRPVSPVVERRKKILLPVEREPSPISKLFFSETSRPVSPIVERKKLHQSYSYPYKQALEPERSSSPISKLYFTETSRPVSPVVERRSKLFMQPYEEERGPSPSSKLYFTETSRPVSPVVQKRQSRTPTPPQVVFRSPSSRRITQAKTFRVLEELKKRSSRSHSAGEADNMDFDEDILSSSSIDTTPKEYKTYFTEILHSPGRCTKFKELNKFYSTLERLGELERTTSSTELRPRGRREEEIIDFDRWKEVHKRERAEKELETLYVKLKDDQREKGFLFQPKDVEAYRWNKDFDRGLRIKEKSVEDIKDDFEKLKRGAVYKSKSIPDELIFRRDLYKPLWRGNSVADLACSIGEKRSQSEGRVTALRKKMLEEERLLTRGIGSRIWSSLSSEQINLLKGQLAEIYGQDGQKKLQEPPTDYSIDVSGDAQKTYKPSLRVRRNSDEIIKQPINVGIKKSESTSTGLVLSESEKKRLSQSLSREVMNRVSQRQKRKTSPSLVLGKETRGAIAAADANLRASTSETASPRTCYSLELSEDERDRQQKDSDFLLVLADDSETHKNNIDVTLQDWAQPKKAFVSTDVINRVTSVSETESGSTDESTRTVVCLGAKDAVQKKVEYFEQVAEERPYTPTIYRAAESQGNDSELVTDTQQDLETYHIEETRQPRKLVSSQSYQDLKELFGEQEQNKFTAASLQVVRPPPPVSKSSSDSSPKSNSNGCFSPNSCPPVKNGEVRYLKNKFEHTEDFYDRRLTKAKRSRSDPELNRKQQIVIPGQKMGEVDTLRRRYEYPWIFGRGRSRVRRGGVVSPIYFYADDRYMPHINIISKIASLYPKKTVFLSDVRQKSAEELARLLGCPVGEVNRLRQKFDSPDRNISLLGHMFTSSPNINELRDIAPYLTASWTAHQYPNREDNTRSLSSPEHSLSSWDVSLVRRDRPRPKSLSPPRPKVKFSPILKTCQSKFKENGSAKQNFDPKIHQPIRRYQPPCPKYEPVRYKCSWPQTVRPSVTFKGVVF